MCNVHAVPMRTCNDPVPSERCTVEALGACVEPEPQSPSRPGTPPCYRHAQFQAAQHTDYWAQERHDTNSDDGVMGTRRAKLRSRAIKLPSRDAQKKDHGGLDLPAAGSVGGATASCLGVSQSQSFGITPPRLEFPPSLSFGLTPPKLNPPTLSQSFGALPGPSTSMVGHLPPKSMSMNLEPRIAAASEQFNTFRFPGSAIGRDRSPPPGSAIVRTQTPPPSSTIGRRPTPPRHTSPTQVRPTSLAFAFKIERGCEPRILPGGEASFPSSLGSPTPTLHCRPISPRTQPHVASLASASFAWRAPSPRSCCRSSSPVRASLVTPVVASLVTGHPAMHPRASSPSSPLMYGRVLLETNSPRLAGASPSSPPINTKMPSAPLAAFPIPTWLASKRSISPARAPFAATLVTACAPIGVSNRSATPRGERSTQSVATGCDRQRTPIRRSRSPPIAVCHTIGTSIAGGIQHGFGNVIQPPGVSLVPLCAITPPTVATSTGPFQFRARTVSPCSPRGSISSDSFVPQPAKIGQTSVILTARGSTITQSSSQRTLARTVTPRGALLKIQPPPATPPLVATIPRQRKATAPAGAAGCVSAAALNLSPADAKASAAAPLRVQSGVSAARLGLSPTDSQATLSPNDAETSAFPVTVSSAPLQDTPRTVPQLQRELSSLRQHARSTSFKDGDHSLTIVQLQRELSTAKRQASSAAHVHKEERNFLQRLLDAERERVMSLEQKLHQQDGQMDSEVDGRIRISSIETQRSLDDACNKVPMCDLASAFAGASTSASSASSAECTPQNRALTGRQGAAPLNSARILTARQVPQIEMHDENARCPVAKVRQEFLLNGEAKMARRFQQALQVPEGEGCSENTKAALAG